MCLRKKVIFPVTLPVQNNRPITGHFSMSLIKRQMQEKYKTFINCSFSFLNSTFEVGSNSGVVARGPSHELVQKV